jgi:DNA polymerase-3 subunit alpha
MATDASGDLSGVSDFAHLHLHTQYSLLDGAIRTRDLCAKVHERGMKAVAVTDHGNMFGAIQFYQEAKKHGVKPIFGCEAYLAEGDAAAKTDRKNFHIVLLARNRVGFANLQKLVSFGHLRGFYYNPRIDRKLLAEHSEGLVGLSACLGGHVSRLVTAGEMDAAREVVGEYKRIFEPGQYFLELQPNGMEAQERVNAALAQLGRDLDVPIVATNDCHYVDREEAHAHEVLMCIGTGRQFADTTRLRHSCDEFFIKSPEQMTPYFSRYPEAFENACRIARACNVELELDRPELPDFRLPEGVEDDLPGYLRRVAREGLAACLAQRRAQGRGVDEDAYRARLEHELSIIVDMQFPGYFLIVWDFVRHARGAKIPVGPGRGSGAGSLVAWALRITDVDPIEYDLLFERFLNPERVSMPDFDIDFCMDRREDVIRYVTARYGEDRVGQIATFHSLKARGLVRDVSRVMGLSVADANEIAKRVPDGPKVTLSMAMTDPAPLERMARADSEAAKKYRDVIEVARAAEKLRQRAALDPATAEVLRIGCSLEGLNRHAGTHAAGLVIGNRPLWEHVPCFQADGKIVTQYTMTDVETAGLVKFDFLGLKTLTVIDTAVRLIDQQRAPNDPLDVDGLPMDDAAVYEMISRGQTTGVFQLESSGFRDLLKKLKPDCFGDIVAAVALYRPGPLEGGMVDQFIECKHGRRAIEYPHPALAPILADTYGVFVYQEQVMQAAQVLAGFTLGGADLMRRAMGKKKKSEMDRQRALFVEGCGRVSGIDARKATEIFDLIDKFAGYGFNKSHSVAYGLITYRTAWLKCHYPVAFMAALMTCDKDRSENVVKFIAEARGMGMSVLGPCVNESAADFTVVVRADGSQAIRFGLGAVRNVGATAVEAILEARDSGGPFTSVFDLARRVDLRRVNKRVLEGLVGSGALDGPAAGVHRARLAAAIDSATEQGQRAQRDRESGQGSLFDLIQDPSAAFAATYPECERWIPKEELAREREALGFYLSGHPLDRYEQDLERHATVLIGRLDRARSGAEVVVGGVVTELRPITTRQGKAMAVFQLEDRFGRLECVVFPKTYAGPIGEGGETLGDFLVRNADEPVFVGGKLEADLDDEGAVARWRLLVETVRPIRDVREERTTGVLVRVPANLLTDDRIEALRRIVAGHGGGCVMQVDVRVGDDYESSLVLGDEWRVSADDGLFLALERLFEAPVARLL